MENETKKNLSLGFIWGAYTVTFISLGIDNNWSSLSLRIIIGMGVISLLISFAILKTYKNKK